MRTNGSTSTSTRARAREVADQRRHLNPYEDYFSVPMDVILPGNWRGVVKYRLHEDVFIAGYRVPSGFATDGASTPRWAWPVFPPIGRYLVAAIVHDHALENGLGWDTSNALFKLVLQDLGIRGWRRHVLHGAVVLHGKIQKLKAALGLGGHYV